MGTLAGAWAHEINNPLTAILTNVQMLLASDELDKESLELIEEATKRCRTIVQKLMAYAKKAYGDSRDVPDRFGQGLKECYDFPGLSVRAGQYKNNL